MSWFQGKRHLNEEIKCGEPILRDYEMPSDGCTTSNNNEEDCHRRYMMYFPTSVCGGELTTAAATITVTLPLVFSVHCLGCSLNSLQHWSELAELYQFVWVNPEGLHRSFNAGDESCCGYALEKGIDDFGFFKGIIHELTTSHHSFLSSDWVYAMGWSNGGYMVSAAASLFRAIAPISGYHIQDLSSLERPTALFLHQALDDHFVQATGCCTDPTMPVCCCQISSHLNECISVEAQVERWAEHNGCTSASRDDTITSLQIDDEVTCYTYPNCPNHANTTYCLYPHKGHFNRPSFADSFSAVMGRSVADFFARHMCLTANKNAVWDSHLRICTCSSSENAQGAYCSNTLNLVKATGNGGDDSTKTAYEKLSTSSSTNEIHTIHTNNEGNALDTTFKVETGDRTMTIGLAGKGELFTFTCLVLVLAGLCAWHRRRRWRQGGGKLGNGGRISYRLNVNPRKRENMVEMQKL
jgi:poly(3-hydroxybutyrate) depolymerase